MNDREYIYIDSSKFQTCLIDGVSIQAITKMYTRYDLNKKCAYVLDKFAFYIKTKYDLSIKDYVINYLKIDWPKCLTTNADLGFNICGKGIKISKYAKGGVTKESCINFKKGCEKLSEDRMGDKNPMWGEPSWNKGLTSATSEILRLNGLKRKGTKASEETREKQRENRKNHPLKVRHNTPHSEETKNNLRKSTASLWGRGVFKKKSSIHLKVRSFLELLDFNSSFQEEYFVLFYSLDFAFPERKIGIEVQGDYHHINPKIYANKPLTKTQLRNLGRDQRKQEDLKKENWTIIEIWETEINDGSYKDILLCKFKELNLLKN